MAIQRYNDILDANEQAREAYQPVYASFWERLGAYVIDSVVLSVPIYILVFVVLINVDLENPEALESPSGIGAIIALYVLIILAAILYPVLMEASKYQATLGKMALKIQVKNVRGGRISLGQAFGRNFGKIISGMILYIGFLMPLWDSERQGLHDKMASTWVVRR